MQAATNIEIFTYTYSNRPYILPGYTMQTTAYTKLLKQEEILWDVIWASYGIFNRPYIIISPIKSQYITYILLINDLDYFPRLYYLFRFGWFYYIIYGIAIC